MIHAVSLPERGRFEAWRVAARVAISHRIPPEDVDWSTGDAPPGLLAAAPLPAAPGPHRPTVRAEFLKLAQTVIWHSAPDRFALLYRALWRLDGGDAAAVLQSDPLGRRLHLYASAIRRDIHKMHAFVRFRELPGDGVGQGGRRRFAAWFEPEHDTLEPGSPFFAKRFADMDWLIATPALSAHFTAGVLSFGPGGPRPDLPEDASAGLWNTYFANIFNPARIKLDAMRGEMPKKYWKNLPETRLIPGMLADAEARVERMRAAGASMPAPGAAAISTRYRAAMPQLPDLPATLEEAQAAAMGCRRCTLCEAASQTVWGTGAPDAALMIVGEQPGDREDLAGRPFVGPAGQLLHGLMAEAGVDPARVWLTNAVKHFKFTPRGKIRLHQNPDAGEVEQCRWWLGLELAFVRPKLVLALGATAALALTGRAGALAPRQGGVEPGLHGGPVRIGWHPSYLLRLRDPQAQAAARQQLLEDLRAAQAEITAV